MASDSAQLEYDELVWGQGQRLFEVFLEPTCPFSGIAFAKLKPLLERVGEDKLTVKMWMHSQPWHMFSSAVSRAVLAASGTEGGKEATWEVMAGIYAHREKFILTEHRTGPNMDLSPAAILRRIAEITGRDLRADFERAEVTTLMKRHARFSRSHGIHSSPTFMIDGKVNDEMGSRDEIEKWIADIGLG